MAQYQWTVPDDTGALHTVAVSPGAGGGQWELTVDGTTSRIQPKLQPSLLGLSTATVMLRQKECQLVCLGRRADLESDGVYLGSGLPYKAYSSLPVLGWVFAVLCLLMCLMGGALPMVIALISAMWCGRISVTPWYPTSRKILSCAGVLALSWAVLFGIAYGVALIWG